MHILTAYKLPHNSAMFNHDTLRSNIKEKERLWKLENAKFISEYNQITDEEGLPLDKWRTF
ncbi:type II toxin-antitoxin system CcdA family antitoxin [Polynucleobacter sp. UK-Gri1-W3]|uniref:type II toxin-antitoxin system CcdA family antitoxin n=1 Tax=Polynucleobacter sp. UK-Gri1-W3 TaxID=1819737 RepID=UPI00351DA5BC